ncbi:hypothetical protein A2635_01760 [Candidatus Peribacteria bacterium RIFCSPHIGHO2_01_FULL_51_9]|nr:MAG: hypothetical protein A2635_01760 [Candidatus Peribacteria bacterium RIFCSPHIGHO2_01_FULL_51_9]
MEEPLHHSEDETSETSDEKQPLAPICRKKNRIRKLLFAVLAGAATFSIFGKPWPEPKPLPKEKVTTKSQARETTTREKDGSSYYRTYDRNGELIFEKHSKNMHVISKNMFHDGKPLGLYPEEHEKNPNMTPEQYIALLAKALDSHEKIHAFFKEFWRYAHDSPDRNDSLKEGTDENHGEYVQTPAETIARIKNGRMIGDCDDLALFSHAVISQQPSRNPHIICQGDHLYTAWIEERIQGGYDAFSIDTTLECNGDFYRSEQDNDKGQYESATDALVTLLRPHRPESSYAKALNYLNEPPYVICTFRPIVVQPLHKMALPRFVPAQAFHPRYPFPWSYDELLLTGATAAYIGTKLKEWRDKRRNKKEKKQLNVT